MKGRGWKEVEAQEDWDFFYADVGWIHENITYAQVHDKPWSPRPPKP
jgi:tubulin polyglutamylase TTLL9